MAARIRRNELYQTVPLPASETWYIYLGERRLVHHVLPIPNNNQGWAQVFDKLHVLPAPVGRSNLRGGPKTEFTYRYGKMPTAAGEVAPSTPALFEATDSGCVSSHRARAGTVGLMPVFFHHEASSPDRCTSR
jgi:hypothetical protein